MRFSEWADSTTSKLSVWDLALVKGSCIAVGMLIPRLVPTARSIDSRVLAAVAIALAVKPAITALLAKPSAR